MSKENSKVIELVNHPTHYKGTKMESIDIIEDFNLGFCLGNAVKYILRAGRKNPNELHLDLHKAIWYIQREIAKGDKEDIDIRSLR